jgi:trehalose 6-phosphate synthase/phosphatase
MNPSLIIVSNRLPVSVKKVDGKLEFYPSVGGLATGLAGYATNRRNKWIGWPGVASEDVTEKEKQQIARELRRHNCYPVFLTQKQLDDFYSGYSNSILWPLFHDVPIAASARKKQAQYWRAYRKVNTAFADVVLALSTSGNQIWVHDYQLLLLPAMLRRERPEDRIGFFLHIPFPGALSYTELEEAEPLVAGMLGADLIGFHTTGYVQNFLDACEKLDVGTVGKGEVILPSRVVRVTDFPMGIDYAKWVRATGTRAVQSNLVKWRRRYRGLKVILTVDRLDPTKGLIERAAAYKEFLVQHPEMREKVVLSMLAVPSRTDIAAYQRLRTRLETLVDDINATFGNDGWKPVDYMYRSMPFEQLTALYQRADVAFIVPLRDGMNLVAKEFLAAQQSTRGVLVLSKTAGAAEELKDAIVVDPARPSTLVRGLAKALAMPEKELKERVDKMQDVLSKATVQNWAGNFMHALKQSGKDLRALRVPSLNTTRQRDIARSFRVAKHRQLFLDYDGTLAPFADTPDKAKPNASLLRLLQGLGRLADVTIVSGRDKTTLDDWLGDLPVTLVAEHGAFVRLKGKKRWQAASSDISWQRRVREELEKYAELTPGAFVEYKESALVWHYRKAKPYYAQKYLVILKRVLAPLARRHNLRVQQGHMILEVRPRGIDKGTAARKLLDPSTDFVLAVGDDVTDEDMFRTLPASSYTIKVGPGRTHARYRIQSVPELIKFLKKLK